MSAYMKRILFAALACCVLTGCGGSKWWGDEEVPSAGEKSGMEKRVKSADYRMPPDMDSLRPMLDRRMRQVFNDSNYLHLAHAEYMGISPIDKPADVFASKRPVVKITDSKTYVLDLSLIHI